MSLREILFTPLVSMGRHAAVFFPQFFHLVFSQNFLSEWFPNVRADILAGLVVALALIPEAIAFSIIAGVDPQVGLYASFCIAVVTAFFGGRLA